MCLGDKRCKDVHFQKIKLHTVKGMAYKLFCYVTKLLTSLLRALQKLIDNHNVKKLLIFMEVEGSVPSSQKLCERVHIR
jgi:hypothetical protein